MPDCIFCKIAHGEIPSHSVWENDRFLVFLDLKPINPGHLLIVPKEHAETVYELPEALYAEAFTIVRQLAAPLARATSAKKIGIAVEGFGVPHAHVHLVPLHAPNQLNPERAQSATEEALASMAQKIKNEIK